MVYTWTKFIQLVLQVINDMCTMLYIYLYYNYYDCVSSRGVVVSFCSRDVVVSVRSRCLEVSVCTRDLLVSVC